MHAQADFAPFNQRASSGTARTRPSRPIYRPNDEIIPSSLDAKWSRGSRALIWLFATAVSWWLCWTALRAIFNFLT